LQGQFFWEKRTKDGIKKAQDYFEQAIKKDPDFALAYVGMANTYATLISIGTISAKEANPRMKSLLEKALEIDDEAAEAYILRAMIKYRYDWDWEGAEQDFKLALQLIPNYMYAHLWYGIFLADKGLFDEALEEAKRAFDLDPLNIVANFGWGAMNGKVGRHDDAIEALENTLLMDPNFVRTYDMLGSIYLLNSEYEKALHEFDKALQLSKEENPFILSNMGIAHAKSGNKLKAKKILEDLLELSRENSFDPYCMAPLYLGLNQIDEAFEWLEKAYKGRSDSLVHLKTDPLLEDLRPDPRFSDLLKKIGLEE
jgi:tetratricopeptide (TPR) repeat protein